MADNQAAICHHRHSFVYVSTHRHPGATTKAGEKSNPKIIKFSNSFYIYFIASYWSEDIAKKPHGKLTIKKLTLFKFLPKLFKDFCKQGNIPKQLSRISSF